jgi:hypothetical protein
LKPGERVVVNGMLSAMPGAKVEPHQVPIPAESLATLESIAAVSPAKQETPAMRTAAQSNSQPSAPVRE